MKQAVRESEIGDPFGRILESLIAGNRRTADGPRAAFGSMAFWDTDRSQHPGRARRAAKTTDFLDAAGEPASQTSPQPLPPNRVEDIRAELGITNTHEIADLGRLRKAFAAANHPDRNAGPRRAWAEERMKLANSIIDAEIDRRRAAARIRIRT